MISRLSKSYPEPAWAGHWICAPFAEPDGLDCTEIYTSRGAPWVRTVFECQRRPKDAVLYVAAPGWCEIYINGTRAYEPVLAPVVTQLTRRTSYICVEVGKFLKRGKNAIALLLGNGWFNPQTKENWEFQFAPWRAEPTMLLQLEDGHGGGLVVSSTSWKGAPSFITMNSLRNGEFQDTRIGLEPELVSRPDFDDAGWRNVLCANPPAGQLSPEECEPCVVAERSAPVARQWMNSGVTIYDFGCNLTGWCELEVEGPAGEELMLEYGEKVRANGDLDTEEIKVFVKSGRFQTDRYLLNGRGRQVLRPHFTYHGFRYVRCTAGAKVLLRKITACFIHSDFQETGTFVTGHPDISWLQTAIVRSYLCNHTGIPTDCPHREKNGWTGDASLALETGLWNFNAQRAALHFGRMLLDAQRPSGQFPGIVPTGGWGYNYGPAWDSYIFEAAWQLWQFHGDDTLIREGYDQMAKYLDFCRWRTTDGVVDYGLWDWCAYDEDHVPETALSSTGFYYQDILRMKEFARHLGRTDDQCWWATFASHVRNGFNARFAHADGGCGNDSVTALSASLYFGLSPMPEKTLAKLLRRLKASGFIADFGILGAKFTGRVLGESGHLAELLRLFTQRKFPGWMHWRDQGATTLWERWNGCDSQTHIMFGDPSACFYRYFAGIQPIAPAFAQVILRPAVSLAGLKDFDCQYRSVRGIIQSSLITRNGHRQYTCRLPEGVEGKLELPGQKHLKLISNKTITVSL